jgi:hypothetical protein
MRPKEVFLDQMILFSYPSHDSLSSFEWTCPDPPSISNQASDMSAFILPEEAH